jgi:4-amino-4-deoxy-L-arabinose transferase-like glycosyltransferase
MDRKPGFIPGIKRPLLWAVLLALGLRLVVAAFLYHDVLKPRRDYWSFGYESGRIARSIAQGQGFDNPLFESTGPTAWMTPVYPLLLAGVFKVFGVYTKLSAWVILSLDSVFSALTCLPIFYLARRSFGVAVATRAAWAWAVFPYAVFLAADLVWENCLTALVVAVLLLLTLRLERPASLRIWIGFGLLWGFAALTSPAALSLLPILAGWACYRLHRHGNPWVRQVSTALVVFLITLVPWEISNYQTFHRFIPLRDNFWLEVWVGNNGDTSNWWIDAAHPSKSTVELAEYDTMGELPYMQMKRLQALAFISHHPGTFAWLVLRRFAYTWTGYWSFAPEYLADEPFDPANIGFSVALTILMLLGLRKAFQADKSVAVLYLLVILTFPAVYYFTHPGMPYRHPIDPEIVLLATYAVTPARVRSRGLAQRVQSIPVR